MPSPPTARLAATPAQGGQRVNLSGRLDATGVAELWSDAQRLASRPGPRLEVDASGVDYCDGSGLALLLEMRRKAEAAGASFRLSGLNARFQTLYDEFSPADLDAPQAARSRPGLPEEVGRKAMILFEDIFALVAFVGEFATALAGAAANPRRVRWRDALRVAETAGADAFPIIVLIGFLMGLIMSFQSAMPLKQFGAEIFVANLLGLSLLRELGPLVTAIILAGRSGSAFAAEIGTMTVNEEINALVTMGLDPVRFLVVTRVLAAMAMTPLLTIFFNLAGLVGGALVMLSLGYPLVSFVNQVQAYVTLGDFAGGMFKALVFSLLVCAIGCQRGLRTRGGASSVGAATTSAVVSGIILIAVADGVFAVVFYVMGW
ncbi:putative phospholipid ABC transporter permease protein MlaE [Fundidesulfovibrio magnetotacticus]|uniref:Putative phospholipid ABC transporter permease protein MlaE n=1 Tax=Fundidesulfovibrio magnetotacticus TaxID=2730080 RepID=A0A6V8M3H3_9BACT|nr:ABC transporter permease [Fundidesulfovibrio magnetotacticus]GFK95015.1 putative phospholipid ABC transporter permease protein MlaE [Fundidesulfovibrio magnetotacticus]